MNVMVVRSIVAIGGWGHGVQGSVSGREVGAALLAAIAVALGCALAGRTSRRRSQSVSGGAFLRAPWAAPVIVLASWDRRLIAARGVRHGFETGRRPSGPTPMKAPAASGDDRGHFGGDENGLG